MTKAYLEITTHDDRSQKSWRKFTPTRMIPAGGLNANQWVDDIKIDTTVAAGGARITVTRNANGSINIEWNDGGTLEATPTRWAPPGLR